MFFFDIFPLMLLVASPFAMAQLAIREYNDLKLDIDLSLAGPAYS
jgi:hypothetical protein